MKRITDLAAELVKKTESSKQGIIVEEQHLKHSVKLTLTEITTPEASNRIGKPIGIYRCIDALKLENCERGVLDYIVKILATNLSEFVDTKPESTQKILVVGLGNNRFVADALGYKVCDTLNTEKHLAAFTPSVSGVTGIKSTTAVKAICDAIKPSHIIVVDSLCCHEIERLGQSFQITNTGIQPGSGITRNNESLDRLFLGIPVIALGVPLVSIMQSHYVVPKTIDAVVARCAYILSAAIQKLDA